MRLQPSVSPRVASQAAQGGLRGDRDEGGIGNVAAFDLEANVKLQGASPWPLTKKLAIARRSQFTTSSRKMCRTTRQRDRSPLERDDDAEKGVTETPPFRNAALTPRSSELSAAGGVFGRRWCILACRTALGTATSSIHFLNAIEVRSL